MTNKSIPVRVIYKDLTRDLIKLPIGDINKISLGIADKKSISLDEKEVLEIHLISRHAYESCQRIEVGNKESYSILYSKDEVI